MVEPVIKPEVPKSILYRTSSLLGMHKPWFKKLVLYFWAFTLSLVIGMTIYIYAVIENPYNLFGPMPALKAIENPENDLSSEVISADGISLGRYFRYHRSAVTFDDLSPDLVNTLIISEDHRFYHHSGLDLQAYLRAIFGVVTFRKQGGGSTLTQQTAKNLFRTREDELGGSLSKLAKPVELFISKTKEWIIAVRLEENFTKEEIIALYLNTVPFNNQAYGIRVAAETYFHKSPDQLNVQESALLVGMLQGTTIYNPIAHPERSLKKRNQVIEKLFAHGYLKSRQQTDSIKALPLQLNFSIQSPNEGPAPYFRGVLQNELAVWCKENGYDLLESGLKIYTTIDSRLQRYAEEAVAEHMKYLQTQFDHDWAGRNPWVNDDGAELKTFIPRKIKQTETYKHLVSRFGEQSDSVALKLQEKKRMKIFSWHGDRDTLMSTIDSLRYFNRFLQTGMMAMEPTTGAIRAWVGGIDHRYFHYDHVRQGARQPGSTFKPFVYGLAMENGYSPCQRYYDISPTLNINGKIYHPKNSNGTYGDGTQYTLRQGMARSLNSITMQLMDQLKPQNVVVFAERLGITSKLDPVYSLGLGTSNVALYDLVGAYSSFVNLGTYIKPHYITRIEDKNGNVIANFLPVSKQVMEEETAYKMIHMFKGGVEEKGGTSQALSETVKGENEIGGKTGTTDNGSDGWYIGITHNLVSGVWVGGEEPSIHFPHWGEGSGSRAALPVWDKFMSRVYSHPESGYMKGKFKAPEKLSITLDCDLYPADSVDLGPDLDAEVQR